jgi:DNA helicase-2/ATP-dependent DNA helicase PcrA
VLADPEQRIFEFAGAEAKRLQQFKDTLRPEEFDLETDNHRSQGTDIVRFGNDILRGTFSQSRYNGVEFKPFEANANQAMVELCSQTLAARTRRLKTGNKNWTVAVLVPTRKMTRQVSDAFHAPLAKLPPIAHWAAVDMEGPILAAELIACLMQQEPGYEAAVDMVCGFYRGKGGDDPAAVNLTEADRIRKAFDRCAANEAAGRAAPANSVFHAIRQTVNDTRKIILVGDPDKDWKAVRDVLEKSACPRMKEIGEDVRNIRLLERGSTLRQNLSQDWRENGAYKNALEIVRQAFIQDHFARSARAERGVVVMNMHKAKGKQFDEVIIFEGWPRFSGKEIVSNPDRIVPPSNRISEDLSQARQNFRVSITRARHRTTIMTPHVDICVLLRARERAP